MFNGLGFDEMFLVALVGILFVKPQQLGQLLRWIRTTRGKLANFQYDLEEKVESFMESDLGVRPDLSLSEPAKKEAPSLDFRKQAKHRISTLDAEEREEASAKICGTLKEFTKFTQANNIAFFSAMETEPHLTALIQEALSAGKNVFLPYVIEETQSIGLAQIHNLEEDLEIGAFGIHEPKVSKRQATESVEIELFLVPGVAFGNSGERLGHGKGYYDRLLASHPQAYKCGIAFSEQVFSEELPQEPHDIKMDALIDSNGLMQFGKKL